MRREGLHSYSAFEGFALGWAVDNLFYFFFFKVDILAHWTVPFCIPVVMYVELNNLADHNHTINID